MASPIRSPLDRQLSRVSRRLYLQTFLDLVVWNWAGALLLATGWFYLQPRLLAAPPDWLAWAVAGGLVGTFTLLAGVLAYLRVPSRLLAALSLDERFGLKERVTTSITLGPDLSRTDAGQALLADVNQRIDGLNVASKYPVSVSRSAALVPLCAIAFVCMAFFYEPPKAPAVADASDNSQPPANIKAIDESMKSLAKKKLERAVKNKAVAEKIEKLDAKLEEIAKRPRKTKDELRERIKEMKAAKDGMEKRKQELSDKTQALQQQLKKMDQLNEGAREGPAKDLQKALKEGNLESARQQLEKLSKKLDKMTDKEKQQLAKQLQKMEDKLKRLANQEDKKKELEKLKEEGKLNQEAFEREMNQLEKDGENLKDLKDLAQKLGQSKRALEKGDSKDAQEKMKQAGDQLEKMDGDNEELENLEERSKQLGKAKDAAGKGMGKEGKDKDPKPNDSDEPNDGAPGAGRRANGAEQKTRSFESKVRSQFDAKGKKIFDGYAPGQNSRKKSTAEIAEEIEQARQEASEAIEQQRIPKSARDMAKGYFRNLGGQSDGKKAPEKP